MLWVRIPPEATLISFFHCLRCLSFFPSFFLSTSPITSCMYYTIPWVYSCVVGDISHLFLFHETIFVVQHTLVDFPVNINQWCFSRIMLIQTSKMLGLIVTLFTSSTSSSSTSQILVSSLITVADFSSCTRVRIVDGKRGVPQLLVIIIIHNLCDQIFENLPVK